MFNYLYYVEFFKLLITIDLVTMEFTTTERGNLVLIFLGFEYSKFRTNNGVITWRCRQHQSSRCHAFLKTADDHNTIVRLPCNHSHDSCPQKVVANIAQSKMKVAMKEVGATTRNVMGHALRSLSMDILGHMPKKSSIVRTLHRQKQADHIPNPTAPDFVIPDKYSILVLYDSGPNDPNRVLAFGDRDLLLKLCNDTIYGDGTFDKSPEIFYQLYTWHSQIGTSYPPCIYFLLQKKDTETYHTMFQILKILLPQLSPTKILVDFEKACMNAAKVAFPDVDVRGCYFHLCQSLIRKVNTVGLKNEYESNIDIKLRLKSLCALAFVPDTDVKNVFDILAATFPDEDRYNEILTYFLSTYIEGALGRAPQFPIKCWNHFDSAGEQTPKTTNCCEGFHNALNAIFQCSHPSIWTLLDGLGRDIACHRLTLANALSGRSEVVKKKYVSLSEAIAMAVQEYNLNASNDEKLKYLRWLANLQ